MDITFVVIGFMGADSIFEWMQIDFASQEIFFGYKA